MRTLTFGSLLFALAASIGTVRGADTFAYVGTYTNTNAKSEGIYLFKLQPKAGALAMEPMGVAVKTTSPSFLEVDARRKLMFAVNEANEFDGRSGGISSFTIDPATGKLTQLSHKPTNGSSPCHVRLSPDGKYVLAANYGSGSVAVYRVETDGKLGDMTSFIQHEGSSVNARQKGPHAHYITFDPTGRYVYVCDLGLDKVMAYQLDANGKLTAANPAFTSIKPGSGPRHMVFRPDGKFAYVVNEINSTVTVLATQAGSPRLTEVQTLSTLPSDFTGASTCAEIQVHPSGKFIYASNRGHDSLAIFAVDAGKGTLTPVGYHPTGGKVPRHFTFDPTGKFMIAENQNTDNVQISSVDAATGKLSAAGSMVDAPAPVCVAFFQAR